MSIDDHELQLLQHINAKLDTNRERIDQQFAHIEREILLLNQRIHAMDANLQRAVDDIAKTKSIADSIKAGTALLGKEIADVSTQLTAQGNQIADLQKQIADLIAAGGNVSAADLRAVSDAADGLETSNDELTQSATDLADANTKLGTAVPANTSPTPQGQKASSGSAPAPSSSAVDAHVAQIAAIQAKGDTASAADLAALAASAAALKG